VNRPAPRPIRPRDRRVRVIHASDSPPYWPVLVVGLVLGFALGALIFGYWLS
jgi:hypothetical protein